MTPRINEESKKIHPFKFSDSFLAGFNSLITAYDKKVEDLNRVKSLIDKDAHHGVCTCSYKMRYITPSDISTFISNLERAMENHLFKPHTSDCDLFAVESAKRFLKENKCVPFDAATIMGNEGADIPKGATLADLTFAAESENFNLIVYSKYELDKRVDCMKDDITIFQNMHFSAKMKAVVNQLPSIMDKKASFVLSNSLLTKALEVYIEDFIIFVTRLNLTTVLQMLNYAVPRAAYKNEPYSAQSNEAANNADNWDEDNDFFKQEAVDSTSVSPVFFVFTKGASAISKAIKKATDSEYSHISISFDPSLDAMYSFGGTSFRKESIHDKVRKDLDIEVYGTFMSKDNVNAMQDLCADFISNIKKTKFDYPALVKKLFGSDKKDNSGYKQICTTFVNRLLSVAGTNLSEKNIPSPEEMRKNAQSKPDQIFQLYSGNSKAYSRKEASTKLKKMGKGPDAKKFDEVVTECCTGFLKTNDYMITNKIPFNCNMRDIVLQDMHPQFKDTLSALKFIMNDERSPVHQLVIQYYTEPIDDYDPEMIIKMFFGCPRHNHWEMQDPNSRDEMANDKANMNTDVNWLDKITYGNMFHDGNYRRDGLGNQHTHPIMNSFETIYKMFGGCDNVCDNAGLSNSLIRISRVMKAIIERYNSGTIPNWEMCRDILSVFGEIFTRHMLRLYYNNNHYLMLNDQMPDAVIPGYMYAESFVLESNGFTSNNEDNYSKVKGGALTAKNAAGKFIGWLRDKLATFLPSIFEKTFQKNCQWFDANGQTKYDEILKAVQGGTYKLPKKDKYYKFKVSFDPGKINAYDIITSYRNDANKDLGGLRKELMNAFEGENAETLVNTLAETKGDALKQAVENAVLYSDIKGQEPQTDYDLQAPDWTEIFEDMKFMCVKGQDGKFRGGKWSDDMVKLSNDLQKAVKELKPIENPAEKPASNIEKSDNPNPTPEHIAASYVMSIGSDGTFMEAAKTKKGNDAPAPTAAQPTTNANKTNNTTANTNNPEQAKAKRDADILAQVQDIAAAFYTASLNTIVTKLFPNIYNNFKGVIDDYDATKKGGSDATTQQGANANANTAPQNATPGQK